MSRAVVVADRLMAVVLGLVLVLVGLALGGWYLVAQGWVAASVSAPDELSTAPVQSAANAAWWPWALGVAGVVLTLLGLRWLAAHLPNRGVGRLRLSGTGAEGRLEVDAGAVASAAADALEQVPGVRSARGRVLRDRGQLVATLRARIERGTDLEQLASACDRASSDLATALARDDLRCTVRVEVANRDRSLPRVR